jgi:hypothetical protein
VLVTNHMVGGSDERRHEKRPAMGESWRNQPHVRIELRRPPPNSGGGSSEVCTATLRASPLAPPGSCVPYVLAKGGLAHVAVAGGGEAAGGGGGGLMEH